MRIGPLLIILLVCNACREERYRAVILHTGMGDIRISLSNQAPRHADNFRAAFQRLGQDSLPVYRIERDFGILFGNGPADSLARVTAIEYEPGGLPLGGSLASVAREPGKLSEPNNFFLILDRPQSDASLDALEKKTGRRFSPAERQAYKKHGGLPQWQGQVTVFGRVTEGLEIAQSIAAMPRDANGKPLETVWVWLDAGQ